MTFGVEMIGLKKTTAKKMRDFSNMQLSLYVTFKLEMIGPEKTTANKMCDFSNKH